jgi:hypothetical protein
MNDILYFIIIITLSIFIVFFGGHNNQEKIEYNYNYFNNLNYIINFEKKINMIYSNNNNIFKNINFININKYLNVTNIIIQNFVDCFLIKINPNNLFNIFNIIDKSIAKYHIMIIFNDYKHNNLELLINNNYHPNKKNEINLANTSNNYFYNLEKKISITGIYHIYNNSNEPTIITCFILKKPFWHK